MIRPTLEHAELCCSHIAENGAFHTVEGAELLLAVAEYLVWRARFDADQGAKLNGSSRVDIHKATARRLHRLRNAGK